MPTKRRGSSEISPISWNVDCFLGRNFQQLIAENTFHSDKKLGYFAQ